MNKEEWDKARNNLQEIIKNHLEVCGYEGFLTDWILITSQGHVHSDGSTGTSYSVFINEHAPIHSVAGLLKYATLKNEHHILHEGFEEDDE